jgi:hypothetical protein
VAPGGLAWAPVAKQVASATTTDFNGNLRHRVIDMSERFVGVIFCAQLSHWRIELKREISYISIDSMRILGFLHQSFALIDMNQINSFWVSNFLQKTHPKFIKSHFYYGKIAAIQKYTRSIHVRNVVL